MEISLEEALDLLRKWQDERRIIACTFWADSSGNKETSNCMIMGRIEELTSESLHIDDRSMTQPSHLHAWCQLFLTRELRFLLTPMSAAGKPGPEGEEGMRRAYEMSLGIFLNSGASCQLHVAVENAKIDIRVT